MILSVYQPEIALRISVNISDIDKTIDSVRLITEPNGRQVLIRSIDHPDIVKFMYVYMPSIGHITEVQIGTLSHF